MSKEINFNAKFREYLKSSVKAKKQNLKENIYMGTKHSYNYEDKKNSNNLDQNQILLGIQNELTKNPHITLDAAMRNVERTLAVNPEAYIEDGQFGIKGVGYQKLSKEKKASGNYKASGYSDQLSDSDNTYEQVMMESIRNIAELLILRSGINTSLLEDQQLYRLAKETINEIKTSVGLV